TLGSRQQLVILAAKRDDPHGRWNATQHCDAIALKTGAIDERLAMNGAGPRLEYEFAVRHDTAGHSRSCLEFTTAVDGVLRERSRDAFVIHDTGLRHGQAANTRSVRL